MACVEVGFASKRKRASKTSLTVTRTIAVPVHGDTLVDIWPIDARGAI